MLPHYVGQVRSIDLVDSCVCDAAVRDVVVRGEEGFFPEAFARHIYQAVLRDKVV